MKNRITLDIEVYKNYLLVSFYNPTSDKCTHFEMYDGCKLNRKAVASIMAKNTIITFNGNGFDLPVLTYALRGATCADIKKLSDKIITGDKPAWLVCRDYDLDIPQKWDHVDLIEVAPGQASLKIYGGRLHFKTLQDLPIEPNATIKSEQRQQLRDYCENDLRTTWALYKKLEKQIALRETLSGEYGADLRSKSDAQIAETVIKSELTKMTRKQYGKTQLPKGITFKYQNPRIITFRTKQLKDIFDTVLNVRFGLGDNGAVKMPDALAEAKIKIGSATYNMGIGGLHSCEKSQLIRADDEFMLLDVDVASYYPSIILQQNLAPKSMGAPFLRVYESIVKRRIAAKRSGDKVTADTLKITINGTFGKLGSKWSALYAPDLMIQTTITGQLALLMLIERMELNGFKVVSANTDGIVIYFRRSNLDDVRNIAFEWMLDTTYELEETEYKLIASRDVNNYVAVKTNGETKGKGVFAGASLQKNPDCLIVFEAVAQFLANGTPIKKTVTDCQDVTQFVTVRRVAGGAKWRDEYLGKAVRFYYSVAVGNDYVEYVKNGNKVPKSEGAKPLMVLPDTLPSDIDYARYINESKELLRLVGYA